MPRSLEPAPTAISDAGNGANARALTAAVSWNEWQAAETVRSGYVDETSADFMAGLMVGLPKMSAPT